MANLRILNYKVIDSKTIAFQFSENLDSTINKNNVEVTSVSLGIPSPTVISTSISNKIFTIALSPLTPFAIYSVKLFSTITNIFRSINGSVLLEDGKTNEPMISGPSNPDNDILDNLLNYLKKTPYSSSLESGGVLKSYLEGLSETLYKAKNTIKQVKSENYLSITITDELHTRGKGPYDRLDFEGAYDLIRAGQYTQDVLFDGALSVASFPKESITLQAKVKTNELLIAGNDNLAGTFNGNILNLTNNNITKATEIIILYASSLSTYTYNIDSFGYQIKDSKYDSNASNYILLGNNQIRLSDKAIKSGFILPVPGDKIFVSYEYKDLGTYVDPTSITVSQVKKVTREICPPIATVFSLQHANITNKNGNITSLNGVSFYDPKATPPYSKIHPAFTKEIQYSVNSFPSAIGQYSIDYTTGKVYVYGSDIAKQNQGAGQFPPVCTYYYNYYYKNNIDFTYDPTLLELASNSEVNLIGQSNIIINYKYSSNFVPGVDFEPQLHKESLNERINNRLIGINGIEPLNKPLTNVFRIFNETTGEIYRVNRFDDSKIIFNFTRPPTIFGNVEERTNFEHISNEILLIEEKFTNSHSINVWKFNLKNSSITSASNDCIGSSINTSVTFSNSATFTSEMYYDREDDYIINMNSLSQVGLYTIDYDNGIVYLAVSVHQVEDVGSIAYRTKYIITNMPHILAVDGVYTKVDNSSDPYDFKYNVFSDTKIDLQTYDISDNKYIYKDSNILITVQSDTINLPRNAKALRGAFESVDLHTSKNPINFATNSSVTFSVANLSIANTTDNSIVGIGNSIAIPKLAMNSAFVMTSVVYIKRISDGVEVYNTTLANGSFYGDIITLPTDTLASIGDTVEVSINIKIGEGYPVIADIDFGGLYVDYTSLYDEILISYEYGDNVLDFRQSTTVEADTNYYVSYKYGALRDALFANFGSSINIEDFKNFEIDLERERYRDALSACLQNFPKGPTKNAVSEIARMISHVTPIITESLFEEWVIGLSYLYNDKLKTVGCSLLPSIWDYGIYFENKQDAIFVPFANNIKLDRGTVEFWVNPNWNGLDNDSSLTINVTKDGNNLESSHIWIGADGSNPVIDSAGYFTISKFDSPSPNGLPYLISNTATDTYGCFIYLDSDDNHWKLLVKDIPTCKYIATIKTSGEFYDVKEISNILESSDTIRTSNKQLILTLNIDSYETNYDAYYDGYTAPPFTFDGVSFMSDDEHYLFDYGRTHNENRISLFKDGKGYLNLKVFGKKDRFGKAHSYSISKNISDWLAGEDHHIAFSNILNSKDYKDELHLFIDGFEVPNMLRYGGRPISSTTDRFRTVVPEIVIGTVPRNTLSGTDLIITSGSNIVRSESIDFALVLANDFGGVGHTLYIEEPGFATSYSISPISPGDDAHELKLSIPMPYSLIDAKFCVNKWTAPVSTELMYQSNLYISRYYNDISLGYIEEEMPGLRSVEPAYSVSVDGYGQPSIVIRNTAQNGDEIFIRTLGMNHKRVRERVYVWGSDSNVININLPPPITLDYAKIFTVNKSKYVMNSALRSEGYSGYSSETIVGNAITTTGILSDTQPSNSINGRTLSVTVSGDNIDFSIPPTITIYGITYSGSVSEILSFTNYATIDTTELFKTISSIDVYVNAITITRPTLSFEIKEKYQITKPENYGDTPIIRFSYQENISTNLDGDLPNLVTSDNISFFRSQIGDTFVLTSPPAVAGSYIITDVISLNSVIVSPNLPIAFTGGSGSIYNVSIARSGFENGLFTFEYTGITPSNYNINQGFYDFDYSTYLNIPFDIIEANAVIGNSIDGGNNAKAIIEEFRTLDYKSIDTRIGEDLPSTGRSITTDYLTTHAFTADSHTLLLMHMDEIPPTNSAVPYSRYSDKYYQLDYSLNSEFNESLYIDNKPFVIDNAGVVNGNAGTIEFWVNPDFDTRNDPKYRYMFDASSSTTDEIVSITKGMIILSTPAIRIYSIQLATDTDMAGRNYAIGGTLLPDRRTYKLGQSLPFQQTLVKVTYSAYGTYGNRMSIYKHPNSTCIFSISSGNGLYSVESPIFWARDTWHRIMATWDFTKPRLGEMHLFVDGEEKVIVTAGSFAAGSGFLSGSVTTNTATNLNVRIKDQFQTLYIGSNFLGGNIMKCKIDNLKISKRKKAPVIISGQLFDNDYNSNISATLPVITDLYTTYLSDFNSDIYKIEDFSILKGKTTGAFDFTLKVIDSFDIINNEERIKQILEKLVNVLKPSNSRAFIEYTK